MSRVALLEATSLLGRELRGSLEHHEVVLMSRDPESIGTLVEVGGSATVVTEYSPAELEGIDLVILCADHFRDVALTIDQLPPGCKVLVTSSDAPPDLGPTVIAGRDPLDATEQIYLAPHPGLLLLVRLLTPLSILQPCTVCATILQSLSLYGQRALDGLFEETRSVVSFQPVVGALGGDQVSFNFAPASVDHEALTYVAREILNQEALELQILQTGVFHATGASVFVGLEQEEELEEIIALYADRPEFDLVNEPGRPSALSSAGESAIQLAVRGGTGSKSVSLWATMDNLQAAADNISAGLELLGL